MIGAWICSKVQSAGVCSVYIRKTLIVLTVVCLALFGAISLLPLITFKSELLHTTPSTSHFYETAAHFLEEPLPQRQAEISEVSPLFFFHQRKAGGSSFREFLATAGTEHNLTTFLPCYNGISCDTYTIGSHLASIYGGHFRWGEQKELDRHRKFGAGANASRKFNCITNFRSPTARLTSCYYYCFIQEELLNRETYGCIGDISPLEFEYVLLHGRTRYGRSCLNEPLRIMSGILDEDIINSALSCLWFQGHQSKLTENSFREFIVEIFISPRRAPIHCPNTLSFGCMHTYSVLQAQLIQTMSTPNPLSLPPPFLLLNWKGNEHLHRSVFQHRHSPERCQS